MWLIWLLSWFLAAGWSAETIAQQSPGSLIAQSVPIWIGAILLFRGAGGALGSPLYRTTPLVRWVGVAVAGAGFALTWWARVHLGRFWSAAVTVKAAHALIRTGPYATTRHPIYTGMLVALASTAVIIDTVGASAGVACITAGLILKLRKEEQFLRTRFGDAYVMYEKQVSALIPWLW
jgi:protein-S-isoprenylcysteine O-methyltransferase Ste14